MLAVMFAAFIIQIVFRYLFNFPVGWTSELTVVMWLWMVLFGSAFVLTEKEEIRFDLVYGSVGRRTRIGMAIVFAIAIVVLYGASLKASYSYVSFMKVEKASYLQIRVAWLYPISLIFLAGVIARYLGRLPRLRRGIAPGAADVPKLSWGL